jgi:hypothetical protein
VLLKAAETVNHAVVSFGFDFAFSRLPICNLLAHSSQTGQFDPVLFHLDVAPYLQKKPQNYFAIARRQLPRFRPTVRILLRFCCSIVVKHLPSF